MNDQNFSKVHKDRFQKVAAIKDIKKIHEIYVNNSNFVEALQKTMHKEKHFFDESVDESDNDNPMPDESTDDDPLLQCHNFRFKTEPNDKNEE